MIFSFFFVNFKEKLVMDKVSATHETNNESTHIHRAEQERTSIEQDSMT